MNEASAQVEQFLPRELLERIDRPLGEATSLPNEAYTSRGFFDLEQRYLFRRTWVLAGYAHELAAPGMWCRWKSREFRSSWFTTTTARSAGFRMSAAIGERGWSTQRVELSALSLSLS